MAHSGLYWTESDVNNIVLILSTVLSFIGCLIILATYGLYKDIRTSSRHIIICITISDLIAVCTKFSSIFLPSTRLTKLSCTILSFLGTTATLWSFQWTMAFTLFLCLFLNGRQELAKQLVFPWFHLACWWVPLAINFVALSLRKLGNSEGYVSGGWCWIRYDGENTSDTKLWMFLDGKGIELLSYIFVVAFCIRIKLNLGKKIEALKRTLSDASLRALNTTRSAERKFILLPVVFLLLRIWGTIRYFMFVANVDERMYTTVDIILMCLQSFGDNFQGAANCILFCVLTPKVWSRVKATFRFPRNVSTANEEQEEKKPLLRKPPASV